MGESWNAPNAQLWLENQGDSLAVLAFEPLPTNCHTIRNMKERTSFIQRARIEKTEFAQLDVAHVGRRYVLACVAMSDNPTPSRATFYATTPDPGTSSLNRPTDALPGNSIHAEVQVPVMQLRDIFERINWSQFPFVEQLKTDCQGHDLKVLKGAGKWLAERVV